MTTRDKRLSMDVPSQMFCRPVDRSSTKYFIIFFIYYLPRYMSYVIAPSIILASFAIGHISNLYCIIIFASLLIALSVFFFKKVRSNHQALLNMSKEAYQQIYTYPSPLIKKISLLFQRKNHAEHPASGPFSKKNKKTKRRYI